jgi:flagellar hook protein FlgE
MALLNSLNSGVTALKTFSRSLEVIGDNIANVNTTAFKGSKTRNEDTFSDLLQRSAPSDGTTPNRDAIQVGTGVQLASVRQSFTQGSISTTGIPSDLAISGNGFFVVRNETTGDVFATRAGDFRIDDRGALMTNGGLNVQGLVDGSISYTVSKAADIATTGTSFGDTLKLSGADTVTSLGLVAGQAVYGTGIPSGATIERILNDTTIQLSVPTTADLVANVVFDKGSITGVAGTFADFAAAPTIVTIPSSAGLVAGMVVTGNGIPAGTTIASVDSATQITLSAAATSATPTLNFRSEAVAGITGNFASGASTITGMSSTAGLKAGMTVSGVGIPVGTRIANVTATTVDLVDGAGAPVLTTAAGTAAGLSFLTTPSQPTTGNVPVSSTKILSLPSTVTGLGIRVGAFVSGINVPTGAYVTKIIGPNQIEISSKVTGPVGSLIFNNLSTAVSRTNPGDAGAGDVVGNIKVNDGVSLVNSSGASADQLDAYGFAGGATPSITSFAINKDGTITCFLNDGKSFQRGRVLLKNFADPHALISIGNNLYNNFSAAGPIGADGLNKTDNTPGNDGLGEIIGGSLELSNVDLTQEFSDLIITQRSFQAASRIITVCDSVLEELVNLKR